jgi:3-oxoacyl-[acyl-carrier-protein] synthase-3
VIGTETLSRIVDWTDRGTCVLFGDGAGAFVLRASETPGGVRQVVLHSDGSGANHLYAHSGMRDTWQGVHPEQSLVMNGREVFRFASRAMVQATEEVLDNAGLSIDDVDMIVPHQANLRIIQSAARGLNLPMERFVTNIERYGNTSTASIPLALVEGVEEGVIQPNNRIVLVGFGAGLTWGAAILEWDVIPTARSRFTEVLHEGWYIFAHLRSFVRRLLRLIEAIIWAPREPRSQSTQPEPEASDEPADNEDEQPPEA